MVKMSLYNVKCYFRWYMKVLLWLKKFENKYLKKSFYTLYNGQKCWKIKKIKT